MESHFSRITDASRLTVGDLMVIPSEANVKKKKLHLSVSSLSKLGISSGFTCRSDNTTKAVDNMLVKDTGKPRVMFISSTSAQYLDSRTHEMLRFIGNSVNDKPPLPSIARATFHELPFEGAFTKYTRLYYVNSMMDIVKQMLQNRVSNNLFFWGNGYNTNFGVDACISEVYESKHSHDDACGRSISSLVPCDSGKHHSKTTPMTETDIGRFFSSSEIFNAGSAPDGYIYDDEINAPRKFFMAYAKRGAVFYTPSVKFRQAVAASVIARSLDEYKAACYEVLSAAQLFSVKLKEGVTNVKQKLHEAEKLQAMLAKEGSNKVIVEQFKEILKCQ